MISLIYLNRSGTLTKHIICDLVIGVLVLPSETFQLNLLTLNGKDTEHNYNVSSSNRWSDNTIFLIIYFEMGLYSNFFS